MQVPASPSVPFRQHSARFLCFPLSRSISPWSSGDKSLFYCREFLSHCTTDSSPRSKTRRGPNPILPPSISPSLPPSGPDYRDSGRVAEWVGRGGGGMLEEGITPLHPRRGKEEREDAQHVVTEDRRRGGRLRHQENEAVLPIFDPNGRSKMQNRRTTGAGGRTQLPHFMHKSFLSEQRKNVLHQSCVE